MVKGLVKGEALGSFSFCLGGGGLEVTRAPGKFPGMYSPP